jgi:hypothetical protein
MSNIALSGNASGTGTFTLASPNSNTDRTLNLPDNSGTVLTSATTTGFPAGSVLQVVSASTSTLFTTTSTSYVDVTGFTASITPSSTSSKILVIFSSALSNSSGSNANNRGSIKLVRASTDIVDSLVGAFLDGTGGTDLNNYHTASFATLDSPSSASSVIYKIQLKSENAANTIRCSVPSIITLMEIAA